MEAVALAEKDPTRTTKVGANLDPLLKKNVLIAQFQKLVVERVPREENDRADSLSKLASASARCGANPILKASLETPSIDVPEEVGVIFEKDDWRVPLIKYLAKGELPQEEESRASDGSAKVGTERPTPSSAPSTTCASTPGKVSGAIAFSLARAEGEAPSKEPPAWKCQQCCSLLPHGAGSYGGARVARKSLHSLSLFFQGILQLSILAAGLAEPLKETLIFAHEGAVIRNKFPLTINNRLFGTPQSLIFLIQSKGAILPYLQLLLSILQLDFKKLLVRA
ncbi:gag-pol polyprotein [Senna tora]|uniref:Gag-pol polyprotein n=1 Tax=Senna tora TaxID=362788 RepID=A0A835CN95_9FABA|nr:gag-pol polyprotein [Senna tora]